MKEDRSPSPEPRFFALSPLLLFLCFYVLTSLIINDFYKIPITVAFVVASIWAIATTKGLSLSQRIDCFCMGSAHKNILIMIWIFILAGAFAQSAKSMGAIDATVNLTLHLLPDNLLLASVFIASCFISLSIGTSVGTIVALTPVAAGIAAQTGVELPFMVAIVVGGAFFGDNLSFISDTTIAATRTQGCRMKDKFLANATIILPPAFLVMLFYVFQGADISAPVELPPIEWVKVLPYLIVLGTALAGVHVMLVLVIGILATGLIGLATGAAGFFPWIGAMGTGITGMGELIIITLLAGGLLEMIRYNGGIAWIIEKMTRHIKGRRGAEFSIALLVSLANLCTANNTIAILTVGSISRNISEKFKINPSRSASILDTFSCFVQGFLPYGAQLLIAAGLVSVSPLSIIRYLYYPAAIGFFAALAILLRFPKKYAGSHSRMLASSSESEIAP